MQITIRPWREEDAPALAALSDHAEIARNMQDTFPHPYTLQDAADYIRAARTLPQETARFYAVCAEGRVVGSINALRLAKVQPPAAEIGYWLAGELWGKGIMSRALPMACRDIWQTMRVKRLYAEVFVHNPASFRVLEKAGFAAAAQLQADRCLYLFENED